MLDLNLTASLATLPNFAAFFGVGVAISLLFVAIYSAATPHHEFALIRAGNGAAAVAFGGALIGFELPLASAIIHSASLADMAVWGVVALLVQLLAYLAARLCDARLSARIAGGEMSAGIFVATIALAVGVLNAACITY
jgi:putative membrane protein